jgi:TPP-dependent indolepyruvate ferredoxin oxidoreductase alpha subunit
MYKIDVTDKLMSYDVTFTPGAIVQDKYRVDKCGCEYCSTCVREGGCEEIFEE